MTKLKRGFAAMSLEKRLALASKGGKASSKSGKAYKWDSRAAQIAGRKGGLTSRGGRGKADNFKGNKNAQS